MGFCCSSSVAVCSHPAPDRRFLAPSRGGGRSHPVVSPFSVNLFSSPRPCQARGGAVRDPSAATRSAAGAEPEAGTVCGAGPPPGAGAAAPQVLHHHLQVGAGPPPYGQIQAAYLPKVPKCITAPPGVHIPLSKVLSESSLYLPPPQKKSALCPPKLHCCPSQNCIVSPTKCITSSPHPKNHHMHRVTPQ